MSAQPPGGFVGYKGCPSFDVGGICATPSDCPDMGECRILYRWSLEERDESSERRRFADRAEEASHG